MFVWMCAYAIVYTGKYFDPNTNVDKKKFSVLIRINERKKKKHVFGSTLRKMKIERKLHN